MSDTPTTEQPAPASEPALAYRIDVVPPQVTRVLLAFYPNDPAKRYNVILTPSGLQQLWYDIGAALQTEPVRAALEQTTPPE